ncbi:MAG: hypothetical protein ACLGG8_01475 [Gammaproteobacteria bacterium]
MSADEKSRKPKLVRDSFTIPKNEYAAIDALKSRAIAQGTSVKKSELLRAGLMLLVKADEASFKAAIAAVPSLKTGRPQADKSLAQKTEATGPATKAAARPAARSTTVKAAAPARAAVARKAPAAKKAAPARRTSASRASPVVTASAKSTAD